MKKIFFVMVVALLALGGVSVMASLLNLSGMGASDGVTGETENTHITIYVQCETAPFIWAWGASDGVDYNNGENWPGTNQFVDKVTIPVAGQEFWAYSFPESVKSISFLFNNGDPAGAKQSPDITDVISDRYFILTWDDGEGQVMLQDVTERYVTIPDAEVKTLGISGNHNGWGMTEGSDDFTVVDPGKTFTKTFDLTNNTFDSNIWEFKLRPNLSGWVGFDEVTFDGGVPTWLSSDYGNFMVDLSQTGKIFTITATWAGGKDISQGWTVKIENNDQPTDVPTVSETFQMYGIESTLESGYVWYSGMKMMVSNPFEDTYKTVSCQNDSYYNVMIDNYSFDTYGGVQGTINPKDEDSKSPASTLKPAASGAVIQIDAQADGWIYVPAKLATGKQYMVFESGVAIGYKYALENMNFEGNVMAGKVGIPGSALDRSVGTLIQEYDESATSTGNGLGVIYFPVKARNTYQVFACGSKISWCGVYWSSAEAKSVKLYGDNGELEIAVADDGKSDAYHALSKTISNARNILGTTNLTAKGINMLETAISEAEQALTTEDDETMTTAKATLTAVIEDVLKNQQIITETIYFNNYQDYYDGWTIQGSHAKLMPAYGISGSYPYCNGSYLYWYKDNTLTITSDIPMVDIVFDSPYSYTFGCSTGQMVESNHWVGDAEEIVFTNTVSKTNRFYSITITYDNPSDEELIERLATQITTTGNALQALTYPVPGKAELEDMLALAATMTIESETAELKNMVSLLRQQTALVIELDEAYKALASLFGNVAAAAEQNPYADPTILAEATEQVNTISQGLASGAYSKADIQALTEQVNYYAAILSQIYLDITVTVPGELGDLILAKVSNFSDVVGLRVSGTLNAADMSILPGFSSLQELDMLGVTNVTAISNNQFRNMQALVKIVLPRNTKTIGEYAFQNCNKLQEVVTPNTLESIGYEAFYNCYSLKIFNFNEGLKTIGYEAFYCSGGYYDEQGIWHDGGSLTEVALPSTLTSIDSNAFYNQKKLTKLTMADGLTTIGYGAFSNCSSLKDITWPGTLTTINSYAFQNCSALTTVELPEGLATLNDNAFSDCSNLQEVILPSSLQFIDRAFRYCGNLTKMTCMAIAAPNPNNNNILGGNESQCTLTVPNLSLNMYKQTPYWNAFNIVGADIMPENIHIVSDYRVNWPETSLDYRPNVHVAYTGSLYIAGQSTFSANNFELEFNGYQARNYSYYDQAMQRYFYNRDNCYAVVLNNAAGARANSVSVKVNASPDNWEFMSLPFDVKVSDIRVQLEGMPFAIRKYDGAKRAAGELGTTWVDLTGDDMIEAGQGFILQRPYYGDKSYDGWMTFTAEDNTNKNNLFANNDVVVPLNEYLTEPQFEHNRSWNFIGNPYATYYDIRAMKTKAPITVWDSYNNNYQAFSPMDDAYILNPGQGFFVQRPIDEESITFLKDGRQIDMSVLENVDYSNRAKSTIERNVFNLTISGNEMGDRTRFVINSDAKLDYEAGRDANKFMSDAQTVELYTVQNGVNFAINERPLADGIIELGLQVSVAGEYTIALNTKVVNEIYLIDHLTGQKIRIDDNDGYTFTTEKGLILGRFSIQVGNGEVTGIRTIDNDQQRTGTFYNLNGIRVEEPAKGVYIKDGKKVVVK